MGEDPLCCPRSGWGAGRCNPSQGASHSSASGDDGQKTLKSSKPPKSEYNHKKDPTDHALCKERVKPDLSWPLRAGKNISSVQVTSRRREGRESIISKSKTNRNHSCAMKPTLPQPAGLAILSQKYSGSSEEGMEIYQTSFHRSFIPAQPDTCARTGADAGEHMAMAFQAEALSNCYLGNGVQRYKMCFLKYSYCLFNFFFYYLTFKNYLTLK